MADHDLDRFAIGADVARSLLPPSPDLESTYFDAFVQQVVHNRIESRLAIRGGRVPPIRFRSQAFRVEGMAFRRLGTSSAFGASNGLDAAIASALVAGLDDNASFSTTAIPEHLPRGVPAEEEQGSKTFIQDTADSILSLVDDCRELRIQVSTFRDRKAVANNLAGGGTTESLRTELRVEILAGVGAFGRTWVDWGAIGPPTIDPQFVANELYKRLDRLRADLHPLPEKASILLPPGWGGTWMHEAVGHLLEADSALAGNSPLYERREHQVAIDDLTIIDDGTMRPSRAEGAFDDEGVPTKKTTLIEAGRVVGLLTDRESAKRFDLPQTGNGRRAHFGLPPRPRMTNLLVKAGDSRRDEMIRSEDLLVIVDQIEHAWLDAKDGKLYLEIEDASLARHGMILGNLGPIIASAEPLDLLRNVAAVGGDFSLDLDRGYCVKDGAALPVTIGQPSVLVRSMHFEKPRQT